MVFILFKKIITLKWGVIFNSFKPFKIIITLIKLDFLLNALIERFF